MAQARTNDAATKCVDCESDVAIGEGFDKYPGYGGDLKIICPTCKRNRDDEKRREREAKTRATAVLMDVLPSLVKLGTVEEVRAGPDNYSIYAVIRVKHGQAYNVSVSEVSESR